MKELFPVIFHKRRPNIISIRSNCSNKKSNNAQTIAVIMCTWDRIKRLKKTIELLEKQIGVNLDFYIWNNNNKYIDNINSIIERHTNIKIQVTHSKYNIGGFGRFFIAKKIAKNHDKVIFIDDDQIFNKNMAVMFLEEFKKRTIHSFWAFNLNSEKSYWDRRPGEPGERVKYCGTGGMICDTSIFLDKELYLCPKRFWFVEDLWLSYFADKKGWKLFKSSNSAITIEHDLKELNLKLRKTKTRFLRYLVKRKKWNISA
ncbi:MAG: glycosyltransferase family 2 protein [Deltaproteobacteria bacterium]|nr:glycosyltransferase family 2 protein [Deltaproteobacteria bacterium]